MSARQMWAAVAVMFAVAIALVIYIVDSAGAQTVDVQIEPDVTVIEPAHQVPVPPVTCTDGTYTFTAGVGPQDFVRILIADELDDTVACTLPHPVTAGGYQPGDPVWNGHHADRPTLWVCQALWADLDNQAHCVRVAAAESGSLAQSIGVVSTTCDAGRWQMNCAYHAGRLAAIGMPDADVQDMWVNGLMARHVWESWGGAWRAWSSARAVGAI